MFAKYAMRGRWRFGAPLPMFADRKIFVGGSRPCKYDLRHWRYKDVVVFSFVPGSLCVLWNIP